MVTATGVVAGGTGGGVDIFFEKNMTAPPLDSPPGGLCPVHCCGWYGNVEALRLIMQAGDVPIDYQDMYGNTAVHYAVYNGHAEFIKVCIDEFKASLLVVNNGTQSVAKVAMESRLALVPKDDWTVEWAIDKARQSVTSATSLSFLNVTQVGRAFQPE